MRDTINFIIGASDGRSMELGIPSGDTLHEMMETIELILFFLGYEPVKLDWKYIGKDDE